MGNFAETFKFRQTCPPSSLERGQCDRKRQYAILDEEYPSLSLDTKLPKPCQWRAFLANRTFKHWLINLISTSSFLWVNVFFYLARPSFFLVVLMGISMTRLSRLQRDKQLEHLCLILTMRKQTRGSGSRFSRVLVTWWSIVLTETSCMLDFNLFLTFPTRYCSTKIICW